MTEDTLEYDWNKAFFSNIDSCFGLFDIHCRKNICTYTAYKKNFYLLLVQINEIFLNYIHILHGYPGVVES